MHKQLGWIVGVHLDACQCTGMMGVHWDHGSATGMRESAKGCIEGTAVMKESGQGV